jgi:hypothetical protein
MWIADAEEAEDGSYVARILWIFKNDQKIK